MFAFLTGLGSSSPLQRSHWSPLFLPKLLPLPFSLLPLPFSLLPLSELPLILLELPLKPKIGEDTWSAFPDKGNGLLESPTMLFHEISNDEGGGLHEMMSTLEMPAAQWTRMLLCAMATSTRS